MFFWDRSRRKCLVFVFGVTKSSQFCRWWSRISFDLTYTFLESNNTVTHNNYSLEPLNFSQIPCRMTDQLSNNKWICEGNECTWEGWGIILVPSHHESICVSVHLSSLVRIEPELYHTDSPTYTTLPCRPRRGNVSRTHGSPVWTPRCPHGTNTRNLRTSSALRQIQHSFSVQLLQPPPKAPWPALSLLAGLAKQLEKRILLWINEAKVKT
jgi:hypothetical protein